MPIITIKMKERSAVRVHQTSINERIQFIFPRIFIQEYSGATKGSLIFSTLVHQHHAYLIEENEGTCPTSQSLLLPLSIDLAMHCEP
jgi:hypothetical protein